MSTRKTILGAVYIIGFGLVFIGGIGLPIAHADTSTTTPSVTTGTLVVTTVVVNSSATHFLPGDFTQHVTGNNPSPFASFYGNTSGNNVTLGPGSFQVTQDSVAGFTTTQAGDCSGTIAAGETKHCTITNTCDLIVTPPATTTPPIIVPPATTTPVIATTTPPVTATTTVTSSPASLPPATTTPSIISTSTPIVATSSPLIATSTPVVASTSPTTTSQTTSTGTGGPVTSVAPPPSSSGGSRGGNHHEVVQTTQSTNFTSGQAAIPSTITPSVLGAATAGIPDTGRDSTSIFYINTIIGIFVALCAAVIAVRNRIRID